MFSLLKYFRLAQVDKNILYATLYGYVIWRVITSEGKYCYIKISNVKYLQTQITVCTCTGLNVCTCVCALIVLLCPSMIRRLGVETLWNFMREMNVAPDAELEAKVC